MNPFDTLRASIESPCAHVNYMKEWDYLYNERIGMLCGAGEPTPAQRRMAREEADAAIRGFRDQLALLGTFGALL